MGGFFGEPAHFPIATKPSTASLSGRRTLLLCNLNIQHDGKKVKFYFCKGLTDLIKLFT
jgi:hypothetical protein